MPIKLMARLKFTGTCVELNGRDIMAMTDNELDITRRTFLKHVDREQLARLERNLGYVAHHLQGLTIAADWHVSYHRSKYRGRRAYYFKWSGIEHVFAEAA
jgi:hypothetical protein